MNGLPLQRPNLTTPPPNSNSSNSTPQPVAPKTAAQWVAGWMAALKRTPLQDRAEVMDVLNNVAQGHAGEPRNAQAVFNDLIAHEAYGVFVEVFAAYNAILASHAQAYGKPFKSTLMLELPRDWAPSAPEEMKKALARVNVQRVEAYRPPSSCAQAEPEIRPVNMLGLRPVEPGPKPEWDIPVSAAACEAIAALLKGGATELSVCGALDDPFVVQEAMDANVAFESLELGEARNGEPTEFEMVGYAALLMGKSTSSRLKQLTLLQAGLLGYLYTHVSQQAPSLAALQSLTVKGGTRASCPHIEWLLAAVAKSVSLTTVSLSIPVDDADHLVEGILGRLKSHPTLAELAVDGPRYKNGSAFFPIFAIVALEVAASCPSIRSLAWDTGTNFRDAAAAMAAAYGMDPSPELLARAVAVGEALKNPAFKLQWLSLRGFLMPRYVQDILFEALAENTWLENFDLVKSGIDIASTQKLTASLSVNTTLRSVVLTPILGNYHSTSDGIVSTALASLVNTLLQQLYARQKALLRQNAFPEMVLDVGRIIATRAAEVGVPADGAYHDVAAKVVGILEQQGALRDIVHLSQLQKGADNNGEPLRYATQREPSVEPLVRLHNAEAVAHNLPDAPQWFNQTDETGANVRLMNAVHAQDYMTISNLLSRGAVDFGGQAQQVAPPGLLRDAFLPMNRVDDKGRNVQLQACIDNEDAKGLRQWIAKGAIDFYGGVESGAPAGPLRKSFLLVNRVDENDANVQLVAAVKARDAAEVLRLRAMDAMDYGRQAWDLLPEVGFDALRAALRKGTVVSGPTTTVTTTNTTAITSAIAATRPRARLVRAPARASRKPDA